MLYVDFRGEFLGHTFVRWALHLYGTTVKAIHWVEQAVTIGAPWNGSVVRPSIHAMLRFKQNHLLFCVVPPQTHLGQGLLT